MKKLTLQLHCFHLILGASCFQRPARSPRPSARSSPSAIAAMYMMKKPGFITCKADTTTPRLAASFPPTSTSQPVRECWGITATPIASIIR